MTTHYKTKGFVFRKNERAEADQNFSVFTKDFGKLELHAKSIRKITSKLRADIDIFYFSEIEFIQGKNTKTITDAIKIVKFDGARVDFRGLKVLNQISETLEGFIKGQEKDEKTFDLISEIFLKLISKEFKIKNYELAFQYFFWNFISLQGYELKVNNCAVCGSKFDPRDIYFSGKEGGIVCKKCSVLDKNTKKTNSDVVKVLRLIFEKDWQTISKLKIEQSSQKLLAEVSESAKTVFCPS